MPLSAINFPLLDRISLHAVPADIKSYQMMLRCWITDDVPSLEHRLIKVSDLFRYSRSAAAVVKTATCLKSRRSRGSNPTLAFKFQSNNIFVHCSPSSGDSPGPVYSLYVHKGGLKSHSFYFTEEADLVCRSTGLVGNLDQSDANVYRSTASRFSLLFGH